VPTFVSSRSRPQKPDSAEALFRLLRPSDANVKHLWAHQADVLRAYHDQGEERPDVALELPTGAGKTLVGLLLAEYRRRKYDERVLYLCPTVHLARQVGAKASGYSIPNEVLTGSYRDYDPGAVLRINRANSIGITTYSTIFNTSPKIDDSQVLILDDAHAAEGPVASPWTVEIGRASEPAAYNAILDVVAALLPQRHRNLLRDDSADPVSRNVVELIGPDRLIPIAASVADILSTHLEDGAGYSARFIGDRIAYCLLYASWNQFLLRPYIPPTIGHSAFADARQRIYMSATPGSGGEIERSFGVTSVHRLPLPAGWEEHGTGRRLFLFPFATLDQAEGDAFVQKTVQKAKRALILAPSTSELNSATGRFAPPETPVLHAEDMERNPQVLSSHRRAVLALANRYDGIDLPDDACRLIILAGLPSGTHLQERFLYDALGAQRVLNERIRARITQGSGRCTRNANDYAAVIVAGQPLLNYLAKSENTAPMHPELQAEVGFGLTNSESPETDLDAMVASFLAQDNDWQGADEDIAEATTTLVRYVGTDADRLGQSAPFEVRAWQAVWEGDFKTAAELSQRVADILEGDELQAYRALWLYFAASFAFASATTPELRAHSIAIGESARATCLHGRWHPTFAIDTPAAPSVEIVSERSRRAAEVLAGLGLRGSKFERHLAEIETQLAGRDAAAYELGLRGLGELLGFEAIRPSGQATPDSAWRDDIAWLVWEAKTEEDPEGPIPVSDVRQAGSHVAWVQGNLGWSKPETVMTFIVSGKTKADATAASIAGQLWLVAPAEVAAIAKSSMSVLRAVRSAAVGLSDDQVAASLHQRFQQSKLDTATLTLILSNRPIARMPTP
jgi:hypothetical protein